MRASSRAPMEFKLPEILGLTSRGISGDMITSLSISFPGSVSTAGSNHSGVPVPYSADMTATVTSSESEISANPSPTAGVNLASNFGPSINTVLPRIILGMPILPVSRNRLSPMHSQNSQTSRSLRPILQHRIWRTQCSSLYCRLFCQR